MLVLIFLLCFASVLFLIFWIPRYRMHDLIKCLSAAAFGNTVWFEHCGITCILVQTTPKGAYSWSSAKQQNWAGGYNPLFELYIPVKEKECCSIQRKSDGIFQRTLSKIFPRGTEIEVLPHKYLIWAENGALQQTLIKSMPKISTQFESLFSTNMDWGSMTSTRGPLFYNYSVRFGWFMKITGLPEGLHREPQKVCPILDNAFQIIKEIGFTPRV